MTQLQSTKRVPVFRAPQIDKDTPRAAELIKELALSARAIQVLYRTLERSELPTPAMINAMVDALVFFSPPHEREYTRGYVMEASINELVTMMTQLTGILNTYARSFTDGQNANLQ